ncbi:Zinc finger, CCHC domain-containing protein [Xylographa bjoerkii]|nr:Zinc finger, CCHC domain-containing protein [Xylographa bjoerkii]
MPKGGDHSISATAADSDLENRLRGLIIHNGIPEALKSLPNVNESIDHGLAPELLPPHLRSAPIAEQQEYLRRHQTQVNDPRPTAPRAQKKPPQAQRRRDVTEKLDLNAPTASTPQASPNKAQQIPKTSRGRRSAAAQRAFQQAVDTTLVPSSDPSNGAAGTSTVSKAQVSFQPSNKARPQTASVTPGKGQQVPEEGHHQPSRNIPSSSMSIKRPLDHQNHVTVQQPYSPGNQRFQAHQHGNIQRMIGQQSFSAKQNHHTGGGSSQISATLPANFARPPMPTHKQLYNPKGQHLDAPSQLNIPVPGPMRTSYLESVAAGEIPKAEITPQELQEKEALRIVLNELCRQTVLTYETAKNASFNAETVALKCFGSLSSGYATHGSDMDLVLVSPESKPDAASSESEIPRILEKVLLDRGYGARLLTRTRVPIIRFCEKPTPELLQALKNNRTKWETERDLPPKPKRKKVENDGKSKNQAKKKSDSMAEKAETRSVAPSEVPEASIVVRLPIEKKKGIYGHYCNPESPKELEAETRSAGPDEFQCAALVVRLPTSDDNQGQNQLRNGGSPQESTDEEDTSKGLQHSVQHSNAGRNSLNQRIEIGLYDPKTPVTSTRPQKPPPERTDEELIRLYILAMTEGWFNEEERGIIYRFVDTVKQPKENESSELRESRAALNSLPDVLSRYREKPQDLHLDFPKDGVGVQCDINFSNFLALHNTLLLRCYSHCDPRIRPMILFVKAWAKKRKINSPYHGTLSSYGYVLMVLHYVVNVASPPLAPNLQMAWKATPHEKPEENECKGCNVRFWRSEKEIRIAANRGLLTTNRQPLGSLLRGFFQYFAQEGTEFLRERQFVGHGFSWSYNVLSLRTYGGILTKQEKGWTSARTEIIEPTVAGQEVKEVKHRYLFAIEDPFEIDHNVARPVAHHGIVAIRDEFRRAHKLILNAGFSNGVAVDLFEEGKEHVQERSFFGPNPARFNRPKRFGPQKVGGDTNGNAPDQQDTRKLKNVPCTAGNTMTHRIATRDPVAASGTAGEVDRGVEQLAADANSQESIDSPDSPISLNEDMRG